MCMLCLQLCKYDIESSRFHFGKLVSQYFNLIFAFGESMQCFANVCNYTANRYVDNKCLQKYSKYRILVTFFSMRYTMLP